MNYGTVCSGVEAFGRDWEALGYKCCFHAEIAAHPSAVLRYHYPDVPNYGDFSKIQPNPATRIDLLCGGTPCQDFSVAGLRAGIAGTKGNLTLEFLLLAKRLGVKWLLWENVPGTFSSVSHDAPYPSAPPPPLDMECDGQEVDTEDEYDAEESHAFQSFLAGLSELGYGVAYRTYDAQYFGVPQRRRRIFLVAYLGDWRRAAAVLLEPESLSGDTQTSGKKRKDITSALTSSFGAGGADDNKAQGGFYIPGVTGSLTTGASAGASYRVGPDEAAAGHIIQASVPAAFYAQAGTMDPNYGPICPSLKTGSGLNAGFQIGIIQPTCVTGTRTHTLTAEGFDASEDGTGRGTPIITGALCASGKAAGSATQQDAESNMLVAFGWNKSASQTMRVSSTATDAVQSAPSSQPAALVGSAVRRLTPLECERLMGYPDNWTKYGVRPNGTKYEVADGPRYQMCGNGWVTPNATWIAKRIKEVDNTLSPITP